MVHPLMTSDFRVGRGVQNDPLNHGSLAWLSSESGSKFLQQGSAQFTDQNCGIKS